MDSLPSSRSPLLGTSAGQSPIEPNTGSRPGSVNPARTGTDHRRAFRDREPAISSQLNNPCQSRLSFRQDRDRLGKIQALIHEQGAASRNFGESLLRPGDRGLPSSLTAKIDENLPHGVGCDPHEVLAITAGRQLGATKLLVGLMQKLGGNHAVLPAFASTKLARTQLQPLIDLLPKPFLRTVSAKLTIFEGTGDQATALRAFPRSSSMLLCHGW